MTIYFRYLLCAFLMSLFLQVRLFAQTSPAFVPFDSIEFFEENDTVYVGFSIIPGKALVSRTGSLQLMPEIISDNYSQSLPFLELTGSDRARLNKRMKRLNGQEAVMIPTDAGKMVVSRGKKGHSPIAYSLKMPYEKWMDGSRLYIKQKLTGCAGEIKESGIDLQILRLEEIKPYAIRPAVSRKIPTDSIKIRSYFGTARLDFPLNRSQIQADFRGNSSELAKINDDLIRISVNPDITVTGISLHGFASPDGTYAHNEQLARERVQALKKYLDQRHKLDDSLISVQWTTEDWEGLKELILVSGIPHKHEILSVMESEPNPDLREEHIKKIGGGTAYQVLLNEMYPELRRVEYRIDYNIRNYSLPEAKQVFRETPELLSQIEMYRIASEYGENTPEFHRILTEVIPEYFPNDETALSNASALLIDRNEYEKARIFLERAPDSPAVWNNLGIVYTYSLEFDKAGELLRRAASAGVQEAGHNLDEWSIKKENHDKITERNR